MSRTLTSSTSIPVSIPVASSVRTAADPQAERAAPQLRRFLPLALQLALLLAVFRVFRVEQFLDQDSGFFLLSCIAFGAFAVHYWLPFRFKETFWVTVSVASIFVLLDLRAAVMLLGTGMGFYLVLTSGMAYRLRVGLAAAGFLIAMLMCSHGAAVNKLLGVLWIPETFWPVFSSLFIFRMIVYAHDLRFMKERPPLKHFLAYFFILPNYYFPWFPVIDYKNMRLGYYRRDTHVVAQQGIGWIIRGTVHLLLYRVVFHLKELQTLDGVHSAGSLIWIMLLTFLLYLRISGQFHIIIGILHLFGYDLPETNHKYLLSRSLTDFWRRINIYWKDFMVKIVYFPVYFKLRKTGEIRAKVVGTAVVFLVTWLLHAYQVFWLRAKFMFSWPDTIFWMALGMLVVANVWIESRWPAARVATGWYANLKKGASVVATMLLIITLWSLWTSPTIDAWLRLMKWWTPAA